MRRTKPRKFNKALPPRPSKTGIEFQVLLQTLHNSRETHVHVIIKNDRHFTKKTGNSTTGGLATAMTNSKPLGVIQLMLLLRRNPVL